MASKVITQISWDMPPRMTLIMAIGIDDPFFSHDDYGNYRQLQMILWMEEILHHLGW